MLRPMRWYWAVLVSLVAYFAAGAAVILLVFGMGGSVPNGPLQASAEWTFNRTSSLIGDDCARCAIILLLATPPAVLSLLVYAWLRGGARFADDYLHCPKCGYILKGLSAPRCPECGEPI